MSFLLFILSITLKKIENELNDILFNSIIGDNYNLATIYNYNYENIKIKHYSQNSKKKIICIFGVLVNQNGMKIEKEMLKWLLPEYDIYIVYQKYPGKLYEYPGLRFAQWIIQSLNKTILLYLHTKGAFYPHKFQSTIREFWMNEFKYPRNQIYIQAILKNKSDISIPFRKNISTWYNGMLISKRAFDLIPEIEVNKNRYFYEGGVFNVNNIRIKGIINDNQSPNTIGNTLVKYLKFHNKKIIKNAIIIDFILIGFIIIFKIYINNEYKVFKFNKKKRQFLPKLIIKVKKLH